MVWRWIGSAFGYWDQAHQSRPGTPNPPNPNIRSKTTGGSWGGGGWAAKLECRDFVLFPIFHVFKRWHYFIWPLGVVVMCNDVFPLYFGFLPGGWNLESQTCQWKKQQYSDITLSAPPLTPPPLSYNYSCGCGFSSGGSPPITTHQANQAYLMNWWGCPHKNNILTNIVHIFENILPPYITIRPDDHVLGWKEIMALHL